jgi:hypothetical protein
VVLAYSTYRGTPGTVTAAVGPDNAQESPRILQRQASGETMKGTPDNTVILHWNECQREWMELPWRDWVRFRGFGEGGTTLLAGAEAGEHYFLVCVLGDGGELANVIPHRYVLSADGRLVYGFDGLEAPEREEYCRIQTLLSPTIEDSERYNELGSCGFTANLPPLHTVHSLLRALPGLAGAQHSAACWDFLSAIGICRASTRAN